jgi:hypothetical protein
MFTWDDPIIVLIAAIAGGLLLTMWAAILLPHVGATRVRQLLIGVQVPPLVVAWLRRGITGLVALGLAWLGGALGVAELREQATIAALSAAAVELGWGLLDQLLKGDQNAVNPPPVAGSGGGDPSSG